jgi:hypothetical protein
MIGIDATAKDFRRCNKNQEDIIIVGVSSKKRTVVENGKDHG